MDQTTPSQSDPSPEAASLGYEPTRVSARAMLWFVVCFIGAAVVIHIALRVLSGVFDARTRRSDVPRSAIDDPGNEFRGAPPLQPSPAHDVLPERDLAEMRRQEDQVFAHLGWKIDPRTHAPSIPDAVLTALAHRPATRTATTQRARSDAPTTAPSNPPAPGGAP